MQHVVVFFISLVLEDMPKSSIHYKQSSKVPRALRADQLPFRRNMIDRYSRQLSPLSQRSTSNRMIGTCTLFILFPWKFLHKGVDDRRGSERRNWFSYYMATCLPEHAGRQETAGCTTLTITKAANVKWVGLLSTSFMNILCTAIYRDNKTALFVRECVRVNECICNREYMCVEGLYASSRLQKVRTTLGGGVSWYIGSQDWTKDNRLAQLARPPTHWAVSPVSGTRQHTWSIFLINQWGHSSTHTNLRTNLDYSPYCLYKATKSHLSWPSSVNSFSHILAHFKNSKSKWLSVSRLHRGTTGAWVAEYIINED